MAAHKRDNAAAASSLLPAAVGPNVAGVAVGDNIGTDVTPDDWVDHGRIGSASQRSGPKFGRRWSGSVNDP